MNLTISNDTNGNKTVKVKVEGHRAFSIQTLGNLPITHREGLNSYTKGEVVQYINKFGTEKQKNAIKE
jgi:hypothetical protein